MLRYILKKLLKMIPLILTIVVVTFFIIRMIPGDPVKIMLGKEANTEVVASTRERLGYNDPILVQLGRYFVNLLHGEMGTCLRTGESNFDIIKRVFPVTFKLALFATLVSSILGVILGIISAVRRGKIADNSILVLTLVFISLPSFFLGLLLLLLFALKLRWFPVYGSDTWRHFVLPVLSLGLVELGYIARTTRSSLLDVISQDYIRTSRAKGLKERVVIYRDALKNALIPIVTSIGLRFGSLLAGATITESVFSIRGIGTTMLDAISERDYTLVQSCILVVSICFIVVNTLTDILYTLVDPRIKLK